MALFQTSITIWFLFILVNGGLMLVSTYGLQICSEIPHVSCGWAERMVSSGINSTNFSNNIQNYTNPNNTLIANLTDPTDKSFSNHTGTGNILDPILDSTDYLLFNAQEIGRLVSGVCTVCNTADAVATAMSITWPAGLSLLIITALGVTNALLLLYLSSGRSI